MVYKYSLRTKDSISTINHSGKEIQFFQVIRKEKRFTYNKYSCKMKDSNTSINRGR